MVYVLVVAGWLLVGAVVGVLAARHGAWRRAWIAAAVFGPFAVPLALQRRHQRRPEPILRARGRARHGEVDLLVGVDGSPSSLAAASRAVRLLGPRLRRLTLATVLDVDTAAPHDDGLYPAPWPEEHAARAQLDALVVSLQRDFSVQPGSVILAGEPADALERFAIDDGYEMIVVGCRGKGLTKLLLGSCAATLACRTKVPVLLVPAGPAAAADLVTSSIASSASR